MKIKPMTFKLNVFLKMHGSDVRHISGNTVLGLELQCLI